MQGMVLVMKKEFLVFRNHDRGILAIYALLVCSWSILLANHIRAGAGLEADLWWLFFSVIVSGNFAGPSLAAERLNGSLEIHLCAGISRGEILHGKMLFAWILATLFGVLCYGLALCWYLLQDGQAHTLFTTVPVVHQVLLYLTACYLGIASTAWLSLFLGNPRLSNFVNFLILGGLVTLYSLLSLVIHFPPHTLKLVFLVAGVLFHLLARRAFESERVLQPVSL